MGICGLAGWGLGLRVLGFRTQRERNICRIMRVVPPFKSSSLQIFNHDQVVDDFDPQFYSPVLCFSRSRGSMGSDAKAEVLPWHLTNLESFLRVPLP